MEKEIDTNNVFGIKDGLPVKTVKSKASICIATPMYGGMCSGLYCSSMVQTTVHLSKYGIPIAYLFIMNESLVTRARNRLVYDFYQSNATHLCFIDADIGFNPAMISAMIAEDKDIIAAFCPKKEINWISVGVAARNNVPDKDLQHHASSIVVNTLGGQDGSFNRKDIVEVEAAGAGIMLIKREVLDAIGEIVPSYTNDVNSAIEGNMPFKIKEFFTTSIDEKSNRLLSEDYNFCKLARSVGKTVWGCPYPELVHTGSYNYR